MDTAILWLRRDLRLADNPALRAVLDAGLRPVFAYVHAPEEESPWQAGAASNAWLHRSLDALSAALVERGSALVLRQGASVECLRRLCAQAGARSLYCNRVYEPAALERDARVFDALRREGIEVHQSNAS